MHELRKIVDKEEEEPVRMKRDEEINETQPIRPNRSEEKGWAAISLGARRMQRATAEEQGMNQG